MKNVEDIYPLSPMQAGMLFHTLVAHDEGLYIEQLTCALDGDLNTEAFQHAVRQTLVRHPILRSFFLWEGLDEPLQVVSEQVELPWEEHDWSGLTGHEQEARTRALLEADRERGYELSGAPLIRAALLKLGERSYTFLFSYHHILLDGWSAGLLLKEVFDLYQAFCEGRELSTGPGRPYRDYIAWLQRQDATAAESFWRERLKGFKAPTPLGPSRPAQARAGEFAEEQIELSAAATEALQAFARSHRLTLNSLLAGAWAILLSRYSGERDVVFGSTLSGRPTDLEGSETMVGLFINTLPVRVRVPGEETVLGFLTALRAQQFELQEYEHNSLVQVRGWSEVPGDLPLFRSILVFENQPIDSALLRWEGPGGSLNLRHLKTYDRVNFPLTAMASPGRTLSMWIAYDCGHFDEETVRRMLGHWKSLLEGIARAPHGRVADLPMLTEDERHEILTRWNLPDNKLSPDATLCELFEKQAALWPDRVAVSCGDRQLTYAELDSRADSLASELRRRGVGPDVVVGLLAERSAELVVGLLGILKAGGAYLPLEPSLPEGRLRLMAEDAGARLVVAGQESLAGSAQALVGGGGDVVCVGGEYEGVGGEAGPSLLPRRASAGNLAYVIYTSGSTGTPKGVMVTHDNVVRLLRAAGERFTFDERDVWTLFHSYAFDFSVWEVWGALSTGGRLVVVPYWVSRSPDAFHELVCAEEVSVLNQTPSAFRQFARVALSRREPTALKVVIFGGEALEFESLKPWVEHYGAERPQLVNMYGITETTVHVTFRRLSAADVLGASSSLVGAALPDARMYVLDERLEPSPVGVAGELFVGGGGVARGYLGRPGLTAERFIPNPHAAEPGARLYRSGDVGRYAAGGDVEYLGRADAQVKIRGFRIELGEIESALAGHEGVGEAAVCARAGEDGEKRLVAYVVARPHSAVTVTQLREHLKGRLPEHMVPSAFVFLDALPLTNNNKVDRRALPDPDGARPELDRPFAAPRTAAEQELARIWRELLGVEQVGIHDNFFELGGHSLLLTQLATRVSESFGVEVPLRVLFDASTVVEMTVAVAGRQAEQEDRQELAQMLDELEDLSADEAAALLAAEARGEWEPQLS
ncbi:MAG TPA: amino acid adenylation domain-containing protein [Pyrinomonadaceae bacterium]|jgi:amino acid adenylation domain-containing protein|nr:amino acid adenylation domain-containing protein [Pyrinomonadaceae bacterium]